MSAFVYKGAKLSEVRFPLGGIGAGCVSIDGGARLVDWELFNRPNKDSYNGHSHIAVKAERDGEVIGARVLNGPLRPPYMGRGLHGFGGYTYGPSSQTMAGVPHFDDIELLGRFPIAEYAFAGDFPADARLTAWSPFEPHDDFDSSLPVALFEVALHNPQDAPIDYSVAFTLCNPNDKATNLVRRGGGLTHLVCGTQERDAASPKYGTACVSTDAADVSVQRNWYRGSWFDGLTMFWQDFTRPGPIKTRDLDEIPVERAPIRGEHGTLCARVRCGAGETVKVRFAMAWHYPNYEKYWAHGDGPKPVWRNWYATVFGDACAVSSYALSRYDELYGAANAFVEALYESTLPDAVKDAAGATLSVLKSPTCVRLPDGSFYGWEGSHARDGSCEGSCQHVWNYQYALPLLFPALERSMREIDFTYNLKPSGSMAFRVQLPIGTPPSPFRACADGQMGAIIKTYREWMLSGDTAWMTKLWPKVKRALEFAWSEENPDLWDPDRTGLLTGRQHHTLDMELFGPSSWLTGMYLAALEAAARMADAVDDAAFAAECRRILEKGRAAADETLYNGEYFLQRVDLDDRAVLERFEARPNDPGDSALRSYWNEETGEIKYQVGEGSSVDQLLGQWHADLCGLGDLFDGEKVRSALSAVYRYNYAPRIGDVFNPCRIYCLQDEAGLLICAYPDGARKPHISVPYAEETMHGFEYAAACHMIQRGLVEEGLTCVKAVRDRYDGERRNPWNEIECGGNYARSMAAWALVLAYQGFGADMTKAEATFAPLQAEHSSVWSIGAGWGKVAMNASEMTLTVCGGEVALQALKLPTMGKATAAFVNGRSVAFEAKDGGIALTDAATLRKGDVLRVTAG